MACARFNRCGHGRRFLLAEEVQQLAESEADGLRKRFISALPINDELKGHLYKERSANEVFEKIRRFATGVCRVEITARGHSYTGSGFHFGDGWILTSSHVLRNREMLNNARFVFISSDCEEIAFEAKPRRAIVHLLFPAGRRTDYHNRDVTLAKLGIQFGRRNRDQLEDWEIEEQQRLQQYDLFDFSSLAEKSFSPEGNIPLGQRESDRFAMIHFDGSTGGKKFALHLSAQEVWKFDDVRLVNFTTPTETAASGCPILLFNDGDWLLAGLFVAGARYGTQQRNTGAGQGLVWKKETVEHIEAGRDAVYRMESFKSYSVFVSFQERLRLICEKSVKEAAQLALEHRILII